jgi:Arc/MetJ family transcription regulator
MRVARTTVDIDRNALSVVQVELGTEGLSATVNTALREVGRRRALARFDVIRDIDGTSAEVEANRRELHIPSGPTGVDGSRLRGRPSQIRVLRCGRATAAPQCGMARDDA